jgi:transposase-like protein
MLFYYFNGRNAARTCRHFGISRQTFYRWKRRFDRHDLTTLRSHRPRRVRKPTWSAELAERVLSLRKQYPRWGKDKLVVLLGKRSFDFDGGTYSDRFETVRSFARAAETRRTAARATETAKPSVGHSQA